MPERPALADVSDLVADAARAHPDAPAVVEVGGRRTSWAELEDAVARLATGLGAAGVLAGQRVMIATGNRLELVTAYLGVLRAQAVAVPVNPGSAVPELARMLADSGARLVVADGSALPHVRDAVAMVRAALAGEGTVDGVDADLLSRAVAPVVVTVGEEPAAGEVAWERLPAPEARPVLPLQDPEKLAVLLYTSGTSGRPRAAMLTHRALLANLDQVARVEPAMLREDDVVLGVLPLFHVYGLNAVLGPVLRHGATLVLVERFDPEQTLAVIEEHRCTVVPVAPPVYAYWVDRDDLAQRLASVRLMLSGSAPLSTELIARFEQAAQVEVHQGYGLTEAAPVVTSTLVSERLQAGSVGAALPGIEIRLLDDAGRAPEGEDPGEISIRGANLFSGYWPDGRDGPDADGWWSTGDVGFLDASGDLFLVDRVKELVIVSGFNVYPREVEDVVREVPGVTEVGVIGVADATTGEAVVVYVVAPGLPAADVEQAVRAECAARLARFKQPQRVEVVDELPLTVTGKVQKGRLRAAERRRALGLLEMP
ncbi:class I adenylate-forming enzyme family protein [Nocardioides taihuensis]|uniref:Class I adenylate-forming enzyme family protein n=1 Tax=Nocardioides taihuensis TaxID=1835606 RepID=A0ABW0BHM3_9ACTN